LLSSIPFSTTYTTEAEESKCLKIYQGTILQFQHYDKGQLFILVTVIMTMT